MAESEIHRVLIGIEADIRPLEAALKKIDGSMVSSSRRLETGFRFLDARIANLRTELAEFEVQAEKTGTLFTDILDALGGSSMLTAPLTLAGEQLKDRTIDSAKIKAELERLSKVGLQGLIEEFKDLESRINALKAATKEGLSGIGVGPDIDTNRGKQTLIVEELNNRFSNIEESISKQITPSGAIANLGGVERALKKLEEVRDSLEQIRKATDDLHTRSLIKNSSELLPSPQRRRSGLEPSSPRDVQLASTGTTEGVNALAIAQESLTETVERNGQSLETQAGTMRNLNGAARDLGFTFASSFEHAVVEGRRLSDVLHGLEQDILRILTRKLVTGPLAGAVTGLIGSGLGLLLSEFHGGGRVGSTKVSSRVVPPSLFNGAPRFVGAACRLG